MAVTNIQQVPNPSSLEVFKGFYAGLSDRLVDSHRGCNTGMNSMTKQLLRKFCQPEGSDSECAEIIHLITVGHTDEETRVRNSPDRFEEKWWC